MPCGLMPARWVRVAAQMMSVPTASAAPWSATAHGILSTAPAYPWFVPSLVRRVPLRSSRAPKGARRYSSVEYVGTRQSECSPWSRELPEHHRSGDSGRVAARDEMNALNRCRLRTKRGRLSSAGSLGAIKKVRKLGLRDRSPKLQIMLVASPRNHSNTLPTRFHPIN
jgi:hypothetical protein